MIRVLNEKGMTILITTNSIQKIHSLATRTLLLEQGKIVQSNREDQELYTLGVKTKDSDYKKLIEFVQSMGGRKIVEYNGKLIWVTEHPEVLREKDVAPRGRKWFFLSFF